MTLALNRTVEVGSEGRPLGPPSLIAGPLSHLTLPLYRIGVERIDKDLPTTILLPQHKNFSIVVENTFAIHYDRSSDGMVCANDGNVPININGVINKGSR